MRCSAGINASLRAWLRSGGVIAYATESCFGLGCNPRNRAAVQRILRLKGRPQAKGLILIAADLGQLQPYLAPLDAVSRETAAHFWPGPTTLLLPRSRRCPPWISGRHDKVAVRITAHPDAVRACRMAGMALVSTSANRTGARAIKTARECQRQFGSAIRILSGRIGARRHPSTLIDPHTGLILRP
jgi:L-threonylcarbamoyladenylate synthase